MALSGITAGLLPKAESAPSPLPLDEEGNLETSDPKFHTAREIIERLFSEKKEKTENPRVPLAADTVEISDRSIKLFESESAESIIQLPDGSRIRITVENSHFVRIEESIEVQSSDPLVIDLNGNGLQLTDVRSGDGVRFDLTGDGVKEKVSWVSPNDGLLAYDRNGNGVIDSGRELFGDQNGAIDGFAELAKYDDDQNNAIDENDPIYDRLRIWQDKNRNGTSEPDELYSLRRAGILSLDLRPVNAADIVAGNAVNGYSSYHTGGDSGLIGEAWLNYYA